MQFTGFKEVQSTLDMYGSKPVNFQVVVYLSLVEAGSRKGRKYDLGNLEITYDVEKKQDKYGNVVYSVERDSIEALDKKGKLWKPTNVKGYGNILPSSAPSFKDVVDAVTEDFDAIFNAEGRISSKGKPLKGWSVTTKNLVTSESRGLVRPAIERWIAKPVPLPKGVKPKKNYRDYMLESHTELEKLRRVIKTMPFKELTSDKVTEFLTTINEKAEELKANRGFLEGRPRIQTEIITNQEVSGLPYNTTEYTRHPCENQEYLTCMKRTIDLTSDVKEELERKVRRQPK